jgi:anti-anti-sigma regulatory factor
MTAVRTAVSTAPPDPPDAVIFAVRGEVDMSTGPLLRHVLLSPRRDAAPQVTVDLTAVSFPSAAGPSALVNLDARTRVALPPLTTTCPDSELGSYPALADAPPFPGGGPDG